MSLWYDPPSGWKYGFPRTYSPLPGESVKDTLIRDGYPAKDAEMGAKYCRYGGPIEELEALAKGDRDEDLQAGS